MLAFLSNPWDFIYSTLNVWGVIFSFFGLVGTIFAIYMTIKISGETNKIINRVTDLSRQTDAAGIRKVYQNRDEALSSFLRERKDDKKMIIVGSSLKGFLGFLENHTDYKKNWTARLGTNGLKTKFLLTHPGFAHFREKQEALNTGTIQQEIDGSLSKLKSYGINMENCVRFYRGTPTCFMIITSDAMLLNPYPYQKPSYESFCLEIRRLESTPSFNSIEEFTKSIEMGLNTPTFTLCPEEINALWTDPDHCNYPKEKRPHIYGQFYWYHYLLPWCSKQAVTYSDYKKSRSEEKC